MENKMIAVRLEEEHARKLEQLVSITGWNQSDIIRRLIEVAAVTPPALWIPDGTAKKGQPLVSLGVSSVN